MKLTRSAGSLTLSLLLCAILLAGCADRPADTIVTKFLETDSMVPNPGQGWMTMATKPRPDMRFPYTVVYRSFIWADAEPEKGKINWALLDSVIAAWKPAGATLSFRVMPTNPHSKGYYASPKWLFDLGCKGFEYQRGGGTYGGELIKRIEPDYADPLYLKHHGEFIAELGKRYDGDPAIEFIDIGSYGMWGEWHTSNWVPVTVKKQIVDFYLNAFKKTRLVFMSDGSDLLQYGLENGTGMRRDGVGSTWHEQNWIGSDRYADVPLMPDLWKHRPIVFEWYGRYDHLKAQGWSLDAAVNFILRNHASIINDNVGDVPPEKYHLLKKIEKLAGARLVLHEVSNRSKVDGGDSLTLNFKLSNNGVAKIYFPYTLRLSLLNTQGEPVFTADAEADCRVWLPGDHSFSETMRIPRNIPPGEYSVAIALEDPGGQRRSFRLAITEPEKNGRYVISKVQVEDSKASGVDVQTIGDQIHVLNEDIELRFDRKTGRWLSMRDGGDSEILLDSGQNVSSCLIETGDNKLVGEKAKVEDWSVSDSNNISWFNLKTTEGNWTIEQQFGFDNANHNLLRRAKVICNENGDMPIKSINLQTPAVVKVDETTVSAPGYPLLYQPADQLPMGRWSALPDTAANKASSFGLGILSMYNTGRTLVVWPFDRTFSTTIDVNRSQWGVWINQQTPVGRSLQPGEELISGTQYFRVHSGPIKTSLNHFHQFWNAAGVKISDVPTNTNEQWLYDALISGRKEIPPIGQWYPPGFTALDLAEWLEFRRRVMPEGMNPVQEKFFEKILAERKTIPAIDKGHVVYTTLTENESIFTPLFIHEKEWALGMISFSKVPVDTWVSLEAVNVDRDKMYTIRELFSGKEKKGTGRELASINIHFEPYATQLWIVRKN